jgi:hypothetical protein
MPFQPGNQEARKAKKAKPFRDALRMEIAAAEQGQPCSAPIAAVECSTAPREKPLAVLDFHDRALFSPICRHEMFFCSSRQHLFDAQPNRRQEPFDPQVVYVHVELHAN